MNDFQKLQYNFKYNRKCCQNCANGLINKNKYKCELEKCQTCPQVLQTMDYVQNVIPDIIQWRKTF